MKRRHFLNTLVLGTLGAACGSCSTVASGTRRRVAITLDDPHTGETPLMSALERDRAMLSALERAKVTAGLFVCGKRVDSVEGRELLGRWNDAGHLIANHSWSHIYYHSEKVTIEAYIADVERGAAIITPYANAKRFFRYPYLKEGNTAEKRDAMRKWLARHDYRDGYVSIDASDWYVDGRLGRRLGENPAADTTAYRDYYLGHIRDRAEYYDGLSQAVLGRSIPHLLLLHHSLLNALFLDDLIAMFRREGWEVVSPLEAYADPVYQSAPDILPAGESILWALAKQTGRFEEKLRYPAEDGEYEAEPMNLLGL